MATVDKINHAACLVYIAGVEVPVSDVTVTYGMGVIPQATITLPASEELVRFGEEDKVPVAIFYLDQWYSQSNKEESLQPEFRLMFDGEIYGWSFSKTAHGDMIVLQAIATISTLNQMHAYFLIGDSLDKQAIDIANLSSQQNIVSGEIRTFPLSLLTWGMDTGSHTEPLERPFDFIENMLLPLKIGGYPKSEFFQGGRPTGTFASRLASAQQAERVSASTFVEFIRDDVRQSAAMNFWVRYMHKSKFDKRWIATPLEAFLDGDTFNPSGDNPDAIRDPTFTLVKAQIALAAQQRALESLVGNGDSFLKILNIYYEMLTYEILMLPTAPYVAVGKISDSSAGIPLSGTNFRANKSQNLEFRLGNYISKPLAYFSLPPECNVVFPSMIRSMSWNEDYSTQVTRTLCGHPFLDYALRQQKMPGTEQLVRLSTTNAWPIDVLKLSENLNRPNVNSLLLYPEEYFKGPVVNNVSIPQWYQFLIEASEAGASDNAQIREQKDKQAANGQSVEPRTLKDRYPLEKNNKDLLTHYTRLAHYEERYKARTGSVEMAFNPYIVPCFPMVVLDKGASKMHIKGLVVGVSHNFSAQGGITTVAQYAFGRTLKEVYEQTIQQAIDDDTRKGKISSATYLATAPALPVKTVANTLQNEDNARAYFRQTFYQGVTDDAKDYVYKYSTYFKTSSYGASDVELPSATTIPRGAKAYNVELTLRPERQDRMSDYNKAMQTVARPICTLNEYIIFINGGNKSAEPFLTQGLLPADVYGVPVPSKIRNYRSANTDNDSTLEHYVTPKHFNIAPSTVYDLRRNWVKRLESYRAKVYKRDIQ